MDAVKRNRRLFFRLFVAIVFLELIADSIAIYTGFEWGMYVMMASIIPSLLLYLFNNYRKGEMPTRMKFIAAGLCCSWMADLFFMLDHSIVVKLFLLGLVASFSGHIFYMIAFSMVAFKRKNFMWKNNPESVIVLVLFAFAFVYALTLIRNRFFGEVQIPIIIYTITTVSVFLFALSRENRVNEESFQMVLIGCFLFTISACLSGAAIFTKIFNGIEIVGSLLIVLFYSAGQFMMVEGCIRQDWIQGKRPLKH